MRDDGLTGEEGIVDHLCDAPGDIDWPATLAEMRAKQIELRGAAADEAPGAYKRLDAVLAAHSDTIRVLHTLHPIGVAMAGADVYDAYKD